MSPRLSKKRILEAYARHPLRAKTILARVIATRGSLANLTENDLAFDPCNEITDQNHVGGGRFVLELARHAEVTQNTRVFDLGCGLGGAARLLADRYGCVVTGIDISPERCRDAMELTAVTGLERLVSFQCTDIRNCAIAPACCDVLLGQAAWSHISDKRCFVRRWSRAMSSSGRIAFEDVCLGRRNPTRVAAEMLGRLQKAWNCQLTSLHRWLKYFTSAGCVESLIQDQTEEMILYLRKLVGSANHQAGASIEESSAWEDAVHLAEAGFLNYVRIIAKRF